MEGTVVYDNIVSSTWMTASVHYQCPHATSFSWLISSILQRVDKSLVGSARRNLFDRGSIELPRDWSQ